MKKEYEASIFNVGKKDHKVECDDSLEMDFGKLLDAEAPSPSYKEIGNDDIFGVEDVDKSSDCNSENENTSTGYTEHDFSKMDNVGIAKMVINNVDLMVVDKQLYNYNEEYGRWEIIIKPEAEAFIRKLLINFMPFLGNVSVNYG